jgi:hypothetical protein
MVQASKGRTNGIWQAQHALRFIPARTACPTCSGRLGTAVRRRRGGGCLRGGGRCA